MAAKLIAMNRPLPNKQFFLVLSVPLTLALLAKIFGLTDYITIANLRLMFEQNFYLSSALYILLFTCGNLMHIPGVVFHSAAIVIISKTVSLPLTFVAAIISCATSFFLGDLIGGSSLRQLDFKFVQRIFSYVDKYPLLTNTVLRFFFQTSPTLNYSLALAGVRFRDFIIGAVIGIPIPLIIYTYFFDSVFNLN